MGEPLSANAIKKENDKEQEIIYATLLPVQRTDSSRLPANKTPTTDHPILSEQCEGAIGCDSVEPGGISQSSSDKISFCDPSNTSWKPLKSSSLENKHQDSDNPAPNHHIQDDATRLGTRRKILTAPPASRGISCEKKIKKIQAAIASSTESSAQQVSQSLSSFKEQAHSASQHSMAEFKTFLSCAVEQYIFNQAGETFISDFDAQTRHIKDEDEREAARQQAKLHAADRISSHTNLTELHLADIVKGLAAIYLYIRLNGFEKAVEDGKKTKSYLKTPPQRNTSEPSYAELVPLPPDKHAINMGSVIRHDSNKIVTPSASISSGDAEDQTTYTEDELFEHLMASSGFENYSKLKHPETQDLKEGEKINFFLSIIPTPNSTNHNTQETRDFCQWVDAESQKAKQSFLNLCKLHRSLQHLLSRNKQTQDSLSLAPSECRKRK